MNYRLVFSSVNAPKPSGSFAVCSCLGRALVRCNVPTRRVTFVRSTGASTRESMLFGRVEANGGGILVNSASGYKANIGIRARLITVRRISYP